MKKKILNGISLVIWLALAAAEVLLGLRILQLDMLPAKYSWVLFALFALIALILGLMMRRSAEHYKKKKGGFRQVLGWLFSLVVIAGSLVAAEAISQANSVIDSVTQTPTVSAVVNIYVMKDDPAQTIDDTKDYTFAVTDSYDWENTQKTVAGVEEHLGCQLNTVPYATVFEMVDALYAGEVDALFMNSAYEDILDELDAYTDFVDRTRVVYEYAVIETVPPETEPSETTAPTDPGTEVVDNGSFIMYLSGSDTRSKVLRTSRSDVNILAVVNPTTRQILLVNTPRDYYVANPSVGNKLDKLTHCGIYGIDCSITALENLYGIDISYYAQINFTGFETLIDAIGGVTVYSDVAFTTTHGKFPIQKGYNDLNGEQALGFARERYSLSGGDRDRGKNQMKIITAVIQKLSGSTILTNYASIMDSLQNMFVTNMPQEKISELVKMQLNDMSGWNILSYAVTGTGGSDVTCSMPGMNVYVMYPNQDTVDLASSLIERIIQGDILTNEDLK